VETVDPETGQVRELYAGPVSRIEPSPFTEQMLAVAKSPEDGKERCAVLWPGRKQLVWTEVEVAPLEKYGGRIEAVFEPSGEKLAIQYPGGVYVIDAESGKTLLDKGIVLRDTVAFSGDGESLIAPSKGPRGSKTIEIIDVSSGQSEARWETDLENLTVAPNGDLLGTSGKQIEKYRYNNVPWNRDEAPFSLAWRSPTLGYLREPPSLSPDGSRVAAAASLDGILLLSAESGAVLASQEIPAQEHIVWSSDGQRLAVNLLGDIPGEEKVAILDGRNLKTLAVSDADRRIEDLAFDERGHLVASISYTNEMDGLLTINPDQSSETLQAVHGIKVPGRVNLNHEGKPVFARQPLSPKFPAVTASEWITSYNEIVEQARALDNNYLVDADPRPDHFQSKVEGSGYWRFVEVNNLSAPHPDLDITDKFGNNQKLLKSQNGRLTAKLVKYEGRHTSVIDLTQGQEVESYFQRG
jgi:hypothetical protein